MAFTSVTSDLTVGQVGQLGAPIEPFGDAQSYEIAAAVIPPGYGVVLDGDTVALPSAGSGEIFAGVVFADGSLPIEDAGYGTTSGVINAPVLKRGRVWVLTSEAVTAEDAVFLQFTTGTGAVGTFRTDADTSGTARAVAVTGCVWDHSASSGKALLRLNLPI